MLKLKPGELARLLDEKGFRGTYRAIGDELKCAPATVGFYINNTVKHPTIEMPGKWARFLEVDIKDLLIENDEE